MAVAMDGGSATAQGAGASPAVPMAVDLLDLSDCPDPSAEPSPPQAPLAAGRDSAGTPAPDAGSRANPAPAAPMVELPVNTGAAPAPTADVARPTSDQPGPGGNARVGNGAEATDGREGDGAVGVPRAQDSRPALAAGAPTAESEHEERYAALAAAVACANSPWRAPCPATG
jgi:hypothetical protein